MTSLSPDHVYIGYWVRESAADDDGVICDPFAVKAESFKKAKAKVETDTIVTFSVHAPGVKAMFYLQKKDHPLIALNNVSAFFHGPSEKDVHVGNVVPTDDGKSRVVLTPKKETKPRKLKEKNFLGYCVIGRSQIALVVPATGYMAARKVVLRLAAALIEEHGKKAMSVYLRNQEIEDGQEPERLLQAPGEKSECLVHSTPTKNGPKVVFPNEFNPKFKPHQSKEDENVFGEEHLDRIVKTIQADVAQALKKARSNQKNRT